MSLGIKTMSSLTTNLSDLSEMKAAVTILQNLIHNEEEEDRLYEIKRKEKKKKKTVEQLIEEIEEDLKYERDSIIDSNIEIENLELKRTELEKHDKTLEESPVIRSLVKAIAKKKIPKKIKKETPELQLIPETD